VVDSYQYSKLKSVHSIQRYLGSCMPSLFVKITSIYLSTLSKRNFKILYEERTSEIKLKKSSPKTNIAIHVLECNYSIHFDIGKDMNILHDQKNKYINSVLEELLIYNEVKRNGFNNILKVQADFKNNDIYQ